MPHSEDVVQRTEADELENPEAAIQAFEESGIPHRWTTPEGSPKEIDEETEEAIAISTLETITGRK